jgi:hypothetical protein
MQHKTGRWVVGGLLTLALALAAAGLVQAKSSWHLALHASAFRVGAKAVATLTGPPQTHFVPDMVMVVQATPIRRPFTRVGPGTYRVTVPLLAPGSLTVQAEGPHHHVLASQTVTVVEPPGSGGYKFLLGAVLIGILLWNWYRTRQMTSR